MDPGLVNGRGNNVLGKGMGEHTDQQPQLHVFGVRETSKWCDGCDGQKASRHFCTEGLCSQVKHAPGSQPGSSCRAGDLLWSDLGWCGASSTLGLGWDGFKLCHLSTVSRATTTRACWRGAGTANAPSHLPVVRRDGIKAVWHSPEESPGWGPLRY